LQEINKLQGIVGTLELESERVRPRSLIYQKIAHLAAIVNPDSEQKGILFQIIGEQGTEALDKAEETRATANSGY
jgi:hypothetical protein